MDSKELEKAIAEGVKAGIEAHKCPFDSEEVQLLKDAATGGRYLKRAVILAIVFGLLALIGLKGVKPFIGK